jgi:hypothetical protein
MTTRTFNEPAGGAQDVLMFQYVSDALIEQTIAGTVKGQMRVVESATGANENAQCVIRIVSGDGTVVRGTLLASDTSALSNEYSATSLTNRKFPKGWAGAGTSLSSVAVQDGDRLVIELGTRFGAVIGSYTAQARHGDTGGTDMAEDESQTTDNVPWMEFSQTLLFTSTRLTGGGQITVDARIGSDKPVQVAIDF